MLGENGLMSQAWPGFELRPQQIEMADAVKKTLTMGGHLAVEAGTGIGKSFAYLIPAIEQIKKGKVLVSTFTITLQEQLIEKDIPFLKEFLDEDFSAALAKGRSNFICLRRLKFTLDRSKNLFDSSNEILRQLEVWSKNTHDGSLSDLGFMPPANIWDLVCSEHGNCRGRKCPHFNGCFYFKNRRKLECADIIVANHALMFSDLVLKEHAASVMPDYRYMIIDEAHNIEHVAADHFGINVSNHRINFLLNGLYNPRSSKGILAFGDYGKVIGLVKQIAKDAKTFFKQIESWYEKSAPETNGRCYRNFIDDNISGQFKFLRKELNKYATESNDEDEKFEFNKFADRCQAIEQDIDNFITQRKQGCVYWVEVNSSERKTVRLISAPLNVGEDLKRCLFGKYESIVLTSATLSIASSGQKNIKKGFSFFAERIGLENFKAVELDSPFDYESQVEMFIEQTMPEPNDKAFEAKAVEAMKNYIMQTKGKAFILFTSYAMLDSMAELLDGWLSENNFTLLKQGGGVDRRSLLNEFKSRPGCVLFGTDSFWQGVDVPGDALCNVIIVRLPFAVPNQPLIAGRIEQYKTENRNAFMEYQLPTAIIKFKQGFGRLIRSKTDTGIIVVLDSRIINKRYGREFLQSVPKCQIKVVT